MEASTPVQRQWRILIALMYRRQGQTVKELSHEFQVNTRTILRDLNTLRSDKTVCVPLVIAFPPSILSHAPALVREFRLVPMYDRLRAAKTVCVRLVILSDCPKSSNRLIACVEVCNCSRHLRIRTEAALRAGPSCVVASPQRIRRGGQSLLR